jgi:hypothetical protein
VPQRRLPAVLIISTNKSVCLLALIKLFSPLKCNFSPQPIFYPLALNEEGRFRQNRPENLKETSIL